MSEEIVMKASSIMIISSANVYHVRCVRIVKRNIFMEDNVSRNENAMCFQIKKNISFSSSFISKKKDFLALGSGLSLFCIKVDAKERQPHRLLGQGMWVWLKRS